MQDAGVEHPWGSWLMVDSNGSFVDAEGRRFNTIRDCFWKTRLGFVDGWERGQSEVLLEFLLALFVAIAPGHRSISEIDLDIFDGHRLFRSFLQFWLIKEGLVAEEVGIRYPKHVLTNEGVRVMRMLLISRSHAVTSTSIGPEAIALIRAMSKVVGPESSRMAAVEAASAGMDFVFVRDRRRDDFTVALLRRDADGEIPLVRTLWAITFETEDCRDRFFAWLCDRVDRWGRWSDLAWRQGGQRLGAHLLSLLACDIPSGRAR